MNRHFKDILSQISAVLQEFFTQQWLLLMMMMSASAFWISLIIWGWIIWDAQAKCTKKKGACTLAVYDRSCILTFQSYANKITLAEASRNDFGRAVRPWRWNFSVFSLSWHAPKSQIQSQQHVTKVWTTFKRLTDSSTAPWLINERKTSERDYAAEQSTLQRRFEEEKKGERTEHAKLNVW